MPPPCQCAPPRANSLELEVAFFGIGLGDGSSGGGAPGTALALCGADGTTKVWAGWPSRLLVPSAAADDMHARPSKGSA